MNRMDDVNKTCNKVAWEIIKGIIKWKEKKIKNIEGVSESWYQHTRISRKSSMWIE